MSQMPTEQIPGTPAPPAGPQPPPQTGPQTRSEAPPASADAFYWHVYPQPLPPASGPNFAPHAQANTPAPG